jgi:hypothetical protein
MSLFQTPNPPPPPPNPTPAAVVTARHILDCHLSIDMHEVAALCTAYADRARRVWALCPAIILIGPNSSSSRCTTATFNWRAAPRRSGGAADGGAVQGDPACMDEFSGFSGLPQFIPGAWGQNDPVSGPPPGGDLGGKAARGGGPEGVMGVGAGAGDTVCSTVSFCVVSRSSKLTHGSGQACVQSPGCAYMLERIPRQNLDISVLAVGDVLCIMQQGYMLC